MFITRQWVVLWTRYRQSIFVQDERELIPFKRETACNRFSPVNRTADTIKSIVEPSRNGNDWGVGRVGKLVNPVWFPFL